MRTIINKIVFYAILIWDWFLNRKTPEKHTELRNLTGKLPKRTDIRTFQLVNYLKPSLPVPPSKMDLTKNVTDWGMMGNDRIGDCTCAAAAHLMQSWTLNTSTEFTASDRDIINAYMQVSGYDPATGQNDNGAVCLDVLNRWRHIGIAGHKIIAFMEAQFTKSLAEQGIYLFGGLYVGLQLPITAKTQKVWKLISKTGNGAKSSWGDHCVAIPTKYDCRYVWCITWGKLQKMTWTFFLHYMDEGYVVLSKDWIKSSGKSPENIEFAQLQADILALNKI